MSKVIRSVAVRVTAEISDFEKKMQTAAKRMQRTAKDMKSVGESMTKMITVPLTAAAVGMTALVNKTANYADEIDKLSIRTQLSYKTLQELKYATDQLGVSFDSIETSVVAFTKVLDDGLKSGSDVNKIFSALGVSLKDQRGNMRSTGDLYKETIKKLSGMKDETTQAMVASKLFGKQYNELLPLLRAPAGELDRLISRANELGLVMGDKSISRFVAFQDKMSEIKMRVQAAAAQLADKLIPIVEHVAIIFETSVIPVLNKAVDIVGRITDKFASLKPETQQNIIKFLALTAAIGPAIVATGLMAGSIANIIKLAGRLIGPLTRVSAAAGGTAAGTQATGSFAAMGASIAALTGPAGAAVIAIAGISAAIASVIIAINNYNKMKLQDKTATVKINYVSGTAGISVGISKSDYTKYGDNATIANNKKQGDMYKMYHEYGEARRKEMEKAAEATSSAFDTSAYEKEMAEWEKKLQGMFKEVDNGAGKTSSKLDDLKNSVKGFIDAIRQQTSAFANFVGLFDVFERQSVSGDRLLNRLKAQINAMTEWQTALSVLKQKGADDQFINMLRGMGPGSVDQIKALAGLSPDKLREYIGLYDQKNSIAGTEASKFTSGNNITNNKVEIVITNSNIRSNDDAEKMANEIVKKLKLAGVKI